MIKIFIGKLLTFSYLPLLYPNLGLQTKKTTPFIEEAFKYYKSPVLQLEKNIESADYILVPHNYFLIQGQKEYLQEYVALSHKYNKKIILFAYGDSDRAVNIPNSIIFRTSQYGYKKSNNEIMMPAYAEDLSGYRNIKFRSKSDKPVIGFCGWGDFKNNKQEIKANLKNALLNIKKYISPDKHLETHKSGLLFRRQAIKNLQSSFLVKTNFIIRKSYSGHINTLELPPEKAREEYINNLFNSDFILSVKGNGNFSYRFYEALSLGRIPLFINTDCVLPLEDTVNYKDFILVVDYKNINKIDSVVSDFYGKLSNEGFIIMQKRAREAFERYLRIDSFFKFIFSHPEKYL